jgi:hypothetical protein
VSPLSGSTSHIWCESRRRRTQRASGRFSSERLCRPPPGTTGGCLTPRPADYRRAILETGGLYVSFLAPQRFSRLDQPTDALPIPVNSQTLAANRRQQANRVTPGQRTLRLPPNRTSDLPRLLRRERVPRPEIESSQHIANTPREEATQWRGEGPPERPHYPMTPSWASPSRMDTTRSQQWVSFHWHPP